jgi:hypothetical protein
MPKLPVDYSKTIIYKLVKYDDYDNENIYIGSTTDFVKRKCNHKIGCNNEKSKEYNLKKNQYIRNNGGWNEWNMIEIEKFPCNDGNEARAREEYWRCHFNAQLNTLRAYRTAEQKKTYNKEKNDRNKDKRLEHYEQNRDKLLEQKKAYYEKNKDNILEKNSQQITCECGCIITKNNMLEHKKTQKHLMKMGVLKYEFVDDNGEN